MEITEPNEGRPEVAVASELRDRLGPLHIVERAKLEMKEQWLEWSLKIPALNFDSAWKVTIIPPFTGAMVRFTVENNGKTVSVYLDCHGNLGYFGEPYWEVYQVENDVARCAMNQTDELMRLIRLGVDA